jgi:hypothetical protein
MRFNRLKSDRLLSGAQGAQQSFAEETRVRGANLLQDLSRRLKPQASKMVTIPAIYCKLALTLGISTAQTHVVSYGHGQKIPAGFESRERGYGTSD